MTLRVAQVARLLSVPRSTAYSWVKSGLLEACKVGEVVLVRRESVENFLRSHELPGPRKRRLAGSVASR